MTVLLFVGAILAFLAADWLRVRAERKRAGAAAPVRVAARPLRLPAGVFFSPSHTWMTLFPSGAVQLGIDDFVGRILAHPAVRLLKADGDRIARGERLLEVSDGDRTLALRSPVDGIVEGRNARLAADPELLRSGVFEDAWVYEIMPDRPGEVRERALLGAECRSWMSRELARLRDFAASVAAGPAAAPVFLQDGGLPVDGALSRMPADAAARFERDFLTVL